MAGLVDWHVRLGELALRLFLLNLLWVSGILAGGILLGLFPSTAAAHGVLRRDQMERICEESDQATPPRSSLWREFWSGWRAEFRSANRLGLVLVAVWALLTADRLFLQGGVGVATPWLSGVVVVVTILLGMASLLVWPVAAHFDETTGRILRMTLALSLSRPLLTVFVAMIAITWLWLLQAAPGVCVVFGAALPFWAVSTLSWRSRVFDVPASPGT